MSESRSVYSDLVVDIAEESLDRVSKILAGVSGGVYKAVGSALSRAAASGKTVAAKAVSQEYVISQAQFRENTKNINAFRKQSGSIVEVNFGFRGHVIPLIRFDTTVSNNGRIEARVKRSESKKTLDNAFVAQVGGHTGIFERETEARFPIVEKFGPSTVQMMYSNEEVMDNIEQKMADTYEQRIDHEITRILNGWGV